MIETSRNGHIIYELDVKYLINKYGPGGKEGLKIETEDSVRVLPRNWDIA